MKYTIIINTYKRNEEVITAINSWKGLKDSEIVVVNDFPADGNKLKKIFNDIKITLINNKKNIGLGPSRNAGIDAANGEYIFFMDDDDVANPEFISFLNTNKKHQDITKFGYAWTTNGKITHRVTFLPFAKKIRKPDLFTTVSAASYLFKRDFLIKNKNIRWKNVFMEDFLFTVSLYSITGKSDLPIGKPLSILANRDELKESILRSEFDFNNVFNMKKEIMNGSIDNNDFYWKCFLVKLLNDRVVNLNKKQRTELVKMLFLGKTYFWKMPLYFKLKVIFYKVNRK